MHLQLYSLVLLLVLNLLHLRLALHLAVTLLVADRTLRTLPSSLEKSAPKLLFAQGGEKR